MSELSVLDIERTHAEQREKEEREFREKVGSAKQVGSSSLPLAQARWRARLSVAQCRALERRVDYMERAKRLKEIPKLKEHFQHLRAQARGCAQPALCKHCGR
jgi:hypothetical protein